MINVLRKTTNDHIMRRWKNHKKLPARWALGYARGLLILMFTVILMPIKKSRKGKRGDRRNFRDENFDEFTKLGKTFNCTNNSCPIRNDKQHEE